MSESEGQVDNWVFDSLVNFLHGSIWKVPVVGFIEEKSVVFDPDSYNNMTEEKEEEFRKIHEEYKAVVDFMLSSFMEDLQVTPEQVEEACRVREHHSKSLPESHITKVALEQLWAAEDFTAFRRLMTRKNIDLQLQSLELLVAKYGVLSPSLRSGDSEEPAGEDGEDDFLQVVIRYSDQLELFKCDYGADVSCPDSCKMASTKTDNAYNENETFDEDDSKNMKLHLSGIQFKNNVAPTPVKYQATLMSSSTSLTNNEISLSPVDTQSTEISDTPESAEAGRQDKPGLDRLIITDIDNTTISLEEAESFPNGTTEKEISDLPKLTEPEPIPNSPEHIPSSKHSPNVSPPPTPKQVSNEDPENETANDESHPAHDLSSIDPDNISDKAESQLIQLEEAEAAIEGESKFPEADIPTEEDNETVATSDIDLANTEEPKEASPKQVAYPRLDEKTAAEIAIAAPEQRRLLTAVRKALEINPEESEASSSIDIPRSFDNDGDLQKRREYLRAQRDKLVAMKKQEREKLLLENSSGGPQSSRPKSARAAQMAIKNPLNMRAATISEKSLSARRALADRLKQELIEKQ